MAKKVRVIALLAAVNRGFWKKCMSSIGWSVCSSHRMNAATAITPTMKATTTFGSVQPSDGPSMMPNSRLPKAMIESPAPSGSRSPWLGSFDFGIRKAPATRAVTAIGTLTQNTALHEKWSSSSPPVTGPMATPSPAKPAQMAIARPRSRGRGRRWRGSTAWRA